jgi:hypothetical protein
MKHTRKKRVNIMPYGSIKTAMDEKEKDARVKIHRWLLARDKEYKRIEYARVSESTGDCVVKWIDRHGETHEDKFKM